MSTRRLATRRTLGICQVMLSLSYSGPSCSKGGLYYPSDKSLSLFSSVGGITVILSEGREFNFHPGHGFSLSLCGPISDYYNFN